jgi:phosphohistidine phosphatase
MKELLLVRHATANEGEQGTKDHERTLSAKGYQDATRLGYYLNKQRQVVDLMLVSPAQRTRSTAEILTEQMHYDGYIEYSDELYQASVRSVLSLINQQTEEINRLLIVGHNPTLTYLAEYLTGEPVSNMAPGGLFILQIPGPWTQVSQQTATLGTYLDPEQLRQQE